MKKLLVVIKLLVAMMALSFFTISAQAETTRCKAITKLPYQIDVAGVYCLKKNLTFATKGAPNTTGNAIVIGTDAPGTVLDLNGFTLSGGSATSISNAIGIHIGADNVTVRNGTVKNFGTGVYASSYPSGIIVENLAVDSNFSTGIGLYAEKCIIRNNLVTNTGGSTAISNASAYGIYADGDDFSIYGNTVMGVAGVGSGYGVGISAAASADRSVVNNNTISSITPTAGIWFQGGTNHIASGNRITKPGSFGIAIGGTGSNYMDNLVSGATSSSYNGTGTAAGTTNY